MVQIGEVCWCDCSTIYWRARNTINTSNISRRRGSRKYFRGKQTHCKFDGTVELEDLKVVPGKDADGNDAEIVISRTTE